MYATEALKHEHRNIERMMTIVQKAGNRLYAGEETPPQIFRNATDFFLDFADRCHYSKEEEIFVPALAQKGVDRDICAIDLLLSEHEQARQICRTMSVAADRFLRGDRRVKRTLVLTIRDYVNLAGSHIIREDHVVFLMADAMLPVTEQDHLLSGFQAVERAMLGADAHKHFEAMLDEMEEIAATWPSPFADSTL